MQPYRIDPEETTKVTAAEIVTPPNYVADVFSIAPGTQVVRREEITSLHGNPQMISVDWIVIGDSLAALGALEPTPLSRGTAHFVETNTHRKITYGQDHLEARPSDAREASALQIAVGAPILAGVYSWSDEKGAILYGEWVIPARRVVSYPYKVTETP